MISIGKNQKSTTALVAIAILAGVLIVNTVVIGSRHNALAHKAKSTSFENSHINVQTDTNQGQACETVGSTSQISNSCSSASSDTITQDASPPNQCTATTHPTSLTLTATNPGGPGLSVIVTGTLTDICTGSGVAGATITFTTSYGLIKYTASLI